MYYSPTSLQHSNTTRANIPFYRPPPIPTFLPPDAQPETEVSKTVATLTTPEEGKEEYQEVLASLKLSEKIHVVGFTREARYITHCLAGVAELPPPQLLAHRHQMVNAWGASNRKLSIKNREGHTTSHEIPMPQLIGKLRDTRLKHIDNLVLSTSENAVLATLRNIRDSINQDTTICLVLPGLGLVEHLNKVLFPDPSTRPTFILGHSGHNISKNSSDQKNPYSLQVSNKGGLFLTRLSLETTATGLEVNTWDRIARHARSQHLIKLLASAPGINATGYDMDKFLRYKLPSMIFSSIADPISVALGFRYERLYSDHHAHRLWQRLWEETIAIVSALPELQERPDIVKYFRGKNFHTEINRHLRAQTGASQWIAMLRDGQDLPIQSMNGWFVQRAEELGIEALHHRAIINMVKAKAHARREELKTDIPFYHSPYMLDNDCHRNDEEISRPAVHVVYTNK